MSTRTVNIEPTLAVCVDLLTPCKAAYRLARTGRGVPSTTQILVRLLPPNGTRVTTKPPCSVEGDYNHKQSAAPLRWKNVYQHNRIDDNSGSNLEGVKYLVVSENAWEGIRSAGRVHSTSQREQDATQ